LIAAGTRIGRYEILSKLGAGGMGEVYLAEDPRLGRKIALKRLPDDLLADDQARRRFEQEAKTTSALNDSHIVTVFDFVSADHHEFIAMEYVEGESLRARLERERLSVKQAVEFAAQAASGLARANSKGIIHRGIKPENLMVAPGSHIKILDFGLAKLIEKRRALVANDATTAHLPIVNGTKPGTILGTVAYMSPEQAEGHELDHRTDIFSLGVVLYEMLTGRWFTIASLFVLGLLLAAWVGRSFTRSRPLSWSTAGTVATQLTNYGGAEASGALSPDGKSIVFVSQQGGTPDLWRRQVAGGETFVSRDGRMLLFNNATTGTRNLWMMPLDRSSAPRQITMVEGDNVMHSSLSPDGSLVAFASRAKGNADIWTQNVDGSGLRQLTNDGAADAWPVWSPDGRWIVYASLRNRQWETWRVQAVGGPSEKVMDGFFRGDLFSQPGAASPLLVSSLVVSGLRLVDFEQHKVLWEDRFDDGGLSLPMFSPDGRFISVPRHETRDRDAIWIYDTATGKGHVAIRFPDPVKLFFRACWADGGKALVVNQYRTISHIVLFDKFWNKEITPQ
jgi:eukaryotic-like serine/threonine-protein kinase